MEERSRDGVPKYDGDPMKLSRYREEALQYYMGVEHKKKYLVGPRLLQELSGVAKTITRTMTIRDPQWLSDPRGVYRLLEYLEQHLQKPSLVEASRHVMKFFYNLQRGRGETMTEWCARHAEALWEASTALRKVQREYEGKDVKTTPASSERGRDSWREWGSSSLTSRDDGPFRDDGRLAEEEEVGSEHPPGPDWQADNGWTWQESAHSWWERSSWKSAAYEPPETWDTSEDIFIPEFLAGFLLLHRSGLEPNEKSNILGTIRGEFSTMTVGRALREQWSDADLAKRDRQKASALLAEEDDQDAYVLEEEDEIFLASANSETQAAYQAEQDRVDEALEAIRVHKATLKEARWNQKQMRLNRNFFPNKPYQKGTSKGKGKIQRFKCGGPHYQDQCPQLAQSAKVADEAAEIAFGAYEVEEPYGQVPEHPEGHEDYAGCAAQQAHVASEVLEQCMGIIDSGATASLGSIDALETVVRHNLENKGEALVDVDLERRPVFKFGNGMTKACVSTAKLQVGADDKLGSMEVHVHDTPKQPVLISKKALKALGAIIDFGENQVIYRHVNDKVVVPLKEAENGHLLMPLTGNITAGGSQRSTPFLGLFHE